MEERQQTVLRTPTRPTGSPNRPADGTITMRPMILGARRGEISNEADAKPKEDKKEDKKDNKIIVINTSGDKLKKKINKIETIKRKKIGDNQKPSELLKYYDYLSYEYPKLLAKNLESKDSDLVSSVKKAFEDKPKDVNKIEAKTSSFVDVELADKLRREMFDTEAKLDMDRRLREEMAKKDLASSKITETLRSSIRIKEAKAKADELRMDKEKEKEKAKAEAELLAKEAQDIYSKLPEDTKRKRRTAEEFFSDLRKDKTKIENDITKINEILKNAKSEKEKNKFNKQLSTKEYKLNEINYKLSKAPRTLVLP